MLQRAQMELEMMLEAVEAQARKMLQSQKQMEAPLMPEAVVVQARKTPQRRQQIDAGTKSSWSATASPVVEAADAFCPQVAGKCVPPRELYRSRLHKDC